MIALHSHPAASEILQTPTIAAVIPLRFSGDISQLLKSFS